MEGLEEVLGEVYIWMQRKGSGKESERNPDLLLVGHDSETQTPPAEAAEDQTSLRDQDHGVCGACSNGQPGF